LEHCTVKYFTLSWWAGETDYDQTVIDDYRRYRDSVIDSLPVDCRRLSADVRLHDSHLRRLHFSNGTLELNLDGCGFDEASRTNFDQKIRLTYRGVRSLASTADPQAGLPGPHGYGDLGYNEIEIIEPGVYEHRMLFSSGIELQVQFSEFSVWCEGSKA
jgi:hypothetical protein